MIGLDGSGAYVFFLVFPFIFSQVVKIAVPVSQCHFPPVILE